MRVKLKWMIVLSGLCFLFFGKALLNKNCQIHEVSHKISLLEKEKEKAISMRENHLLHLRSVNDPAWVELLLMRELGVVPEGKLKVYFK